MKKYGYVIEMRPGSQNSGFYRQEIGDYAGPLRSADVFSTRKQAYDLRYDNETVRKVELYKNGKAKRVVKR